jgi:hypothetical protein
MQNEIFIDWVTVSQHFKKGGLPILSGGVIVFYDAQGNPRSERNQSTSITGSHDTRLRIGCDGYRLSLSGNIGRFSRKDNLYNFGWEQTKYAINGVLASLGFPTFSPSKGIEGHQDYERGAVFSRLDITCNYATGNELQARQAIRWLGSQSIARSKKGISGDESVWWANTRHMLKAYIKHLEMLAHGALEDDESFIHARDLGILRVELELKKRTLSELHLNDWGNITQEKLEQVFHENTALLHKIDNSNEANILDIIPKSSRVYASCWLQGQDLKGLLAERTLYRHAKVLREYGIDILSERNITQLKTKPRILELVPTVAPDWYIAREKAA